MTARAAIISGDEGTVSDLAAAFPQLDPEAPDYDYLRSVAADLVPFGNLVGTEITEISGEQAVVTIAATETVNNHMNTVHAGAQFTAADIAGALAFIGAAAPRLHTIERLVLRAGTVNYRRPASGRIRAVAHIDERELRAVLAATGGGRFDVTAKAVVLDDADVITAKLTFDYVCDVAVATGGPQR
ncbi:DUF4442 domain-containing protein [Nocardia farcinica]|nr:DUF4442 domain-containing protein [Nocardia farcinica]